MNSYLMWIIAISAVLGGLDKVFGNRFGLGKRFDDGFALIGPIISGMVGIMCLSPLISKGLQFTIAPVFRSLGLDPAVLAGILAIDMGGFSLAADMAADPAIGLLSGVFIASTFGCTLIFTIPVGYGMMKEDRRPDFIRGIMSGLIILPLTLLLGGLFSGISLPYTAGQSLPIILLALILAWGMKTRPTRMASAFTVFAKIIQAVSVFGILAGLIEYLTGHALLPGLFSFRESMLNAALCGILLIGSLPFAEIMTRIFRKPLHLMGTRIRMQDRGITGMLLSLVSVPAGLGMMTEMNARDVVMNAAFLVSAASTFGPHLGVCAANVPEMTGTFICTKLLGGFLTILFVYLTQLRDRTERSA
ncbi:MAG: ethanolamine utilization protein EutH [Flexilinea sp.]|nr:ethanolamine utilization protein EutH [Flexilinea sp.]